MTTKTKPSPRFAFKVPANKAGKAFLAAVRKNLNRDHYTVRLCNSGPREKGAQSTRMDDATHYRIYIDLTKELRDMQWAERMDKTRRNNEVINELQRQLDMAGEAYETLTTEHDAVKAKHLSLSHSHGENLTRVNFLDHEVFRKNNMLTTQLSINADMRRYWHNRSVWFYLVCALRAMSGRPNNFQLFQDQPQQPVA